MSDAPPIRVIRPTDVVWGESPSLPQETDSPGRDFTAAESPDRKFSVGYWERDTQSRPIVRPYHEVAYILEGTVEVELEDGTLITAGPGDILDTPKGCKGYWRSTTPVRKVWAIYED